MKLFYGLSIVCFCLFAFSLKGLAQSVSSNSEAHERNRTHQEFLEKIQPKSILGQDKKELPFKKLSEVPQEALEEMQSFFERCGEEHLLRSHYNCECLASEFLVERINLGPIVSQNQVLGNIQGKCIDTVATAGYAYENCLIYGVLNYQGGMSPTEYCECIGRNYSILMNRSTFSNLNARIIKSNMVSATLRCTNTGQNVRNPFPRLDLKK